MKAKRFNSLLKRYKYDGEAFDELYEYFYPRIVAFIDGRYGDGGNETAHDFFIRLQNFRSESLSVKFPCGWVYAVCCRSYVMRHEGVLKPLGFIDVFGGVVLPKGCTPERLAPI